ncbi:MAG TPA: hypothetical protein V6C81_20945 [Planktothrix sp.]
MMKISKILLATLILLCTTHGAMSYQPSNTAEALTAAVRADKDVEQYQPLRISLNGSEADVFTVVNVKAANVDRDCRIDAALIAKTITKADSSITIVRVRFFEEKTNNYHEVEVHLGDVAAFTSGAINEEQLLKSLKIIVYASNSGTSILNTSQPKTKLPPNMEWFSQQGISFIHPSDWVFHTMDNKWFIGQLDNSIDNVWTGMQIRAYKDAKSTSEAISWDEVWWKNHGIIILKRGTRKVGEGRYNAEFIECLDTTAKPQQNQYHLFFSDPIHGIYGLKLLYYNRAAGRVMPIFEKIVQSVRLGQS